MKIAHTCPSNQWSVESFRRLIDANEEQEVRVAASYDRPIDRVLIREQCVAAVLLYAMPAGNA